MPYIPRKSRSDVQNFGPCNAGELNYLITQICLKYINGGEQLHYQDLNDVIGALEGAKLEFYRRLVAPYEDTKIKENGDVY